MVRLLPHKASSWLGMSGQFQSHNGAIAARCAALCWRCVVLVSIPQWCDCCPPPSLYLLGVCCSFNPTMVRLLPWTPPAMETRSVFQSHNGAIAAKPPHPLTSSPLLVSIPQWCDCCSLTLQPMCQSRKFQSHNGAIAADENIFGQFNEVSVSIPQWCDCCSFVSKYGDRVQRVSIPQWCDCCFYLRAHADACHLGFNPTMVRLLPTLTLKQPPHTTKFQSHNGAIAALSLTSVMSFMLRFNPTMVRLLLAAMLSTVPLIPFQSHNGAIAAVSSRAVGSRKSQFQSHNGAIAALFINCPLPR